MNIFNRITATISGTVDKAVSKVENHDAVVEVALKDTRSAIAKANIRLNRIHKDGNSMRQKLKELNEMTQKWEQRAKSIAKEDEQKALQCVQRRNVCRSQASQIEDSLKQHQQLEEKIGQTVQNMELKLIELTQQRNMMRTRHSTADALRVISQIEDNSSLGVEDTFDRWEMLIAETEYAGGAYNNFDDSFEYSFAKAEEGDDLKADLDDILNQDNKE